MSEWKRALIFLTPFGILFMVILICNLFEKVTYYRLKRKKLQRIGNLGLLLTDGKDRTTKHYW